MHTSDRFLLIIPLCACIVALCSLAWHSTPVRSKREARFRHLHGLQLPATADGAWDASITDDDAEWPGADFLWPGGAGPSQSNPARAGPSTDDAPGSSESHDAPGSSESHDASGSSESGCKRNSGDLRGDGECAGTGEVPHEHEQPDGGSEPGNGRHGDGYTTDTQDDETEETDEGEMDEESAIADAKRVGMCAAAASEQVQCVLNSGGGARGECSTSKVAACLSRLEIAQARPGTASVVVPTRYGRIVVPLSDSFEGLALLFYGEWMEWGLSVLAQLVAPGSTVLDINPGTGSTTIALAHILGPSGRFSPATPPQQHQTPSPSPFRPPLSPRRSRREAYPPAPTYTPAP